MAEKLSEYRKKRNFEVTGEPSGDAGKDKKTKGKKGRAPLKFAVQYHLARRAHYDFRLEWEDALLSWAVPKGPSYNPKDKRLAVKVEDHPLEYAGFEGTIPKGEYGGGTVMLWDEGSWTPENDIEEGLEKGSLKFSLSGKRLKGKWTLIRMKDKEGEEDDNWLLIKEKDEYVKKTAGISAHKRSVSSGRTPAEIAKATDKRAAKNPFSSVDVQLAKLLDSVPEEDGWVYEVKYDGYRIVAYTEGDKAKLASRNKHDFTDKFPTIANALAEWSDGRAIVLDGEVVVTDKDGRSDFQSLQGYIRGTDDNAPAYMAFDLLALDGEDLRALPLTERKKRLEELLSSAPENIRYSKHVAGGGKECFKAAAKLKLEGIVGKRADSVYSGSRNGEWIKLKCYNRQEFVVGGYTRTEGRDEGLSALLLGYYENGRLRYAGRAGTGFDRENTAELLKSFKTLKAERSPFGDDDTGMKRGAKESVFWLKPKLVAEIQYAERTRENLLRQASFKGLRTDKPARDVVMETPIESGKEIIGKGKEMVKKKVIKSTEKAVKSNETAVSTPKTVKKSKTNAALKNEQNDEIKVCSVLISNPGKIVYTSPEVKKLDVIRYYEKVSKRMLGYAGGRVLSVVRCHKGVSSQCFYKKHPATKNEGVEVISITNSEGVSDEYFFIENQRGLISEAQLGSIEFHVWGSRAEDLDKPDMMVFDLDPDEGMELERVRQGVRDLKKVLDGLKLRSFLKTSGGKGYHVVVPFTPSVGWEAFHDFAERIAHIMETEYPDRYTSNVRKVKRKGKIFIDWMRNGRGATSVAPYSLRARPGAHVSMPISWRELDSVAPDGIDIFEAERRLKRPDPWKNFFKTNQKIKL